MHCCRGLPRSPSRSSTPSSASKPCWRCSRLLGWNDPGRHRQAARGAAAAGAVRRHRSTRACHHGVVPADFCRAGRRCAAAGRRRSRSARSTGRRRALPHAPLADVDELCGLSGRGSGDRLQSALLPVQRSGLGALRAVADSGRAIFWHVFWASFLPSLALTMMGAFCATLGDMSDPVAGLKPFMPRVAVSALYHRRDRRLVGQQRADLLFLRPDAAGDRPQGASLHSDCCWTWSLRH